MRHELTQATMRRSAEEPSISLVINRKQGGIDIHPREWDEDTHELDHSVQLHQHDRVDIHVHDLNNPDPITSITMRSNMEATAFDGNDLYEARDIVANKGNT